MDIEQRALCARLGVAHTPPRSNQLVVVSAGVFDGDAVQGVRYPSPDHMSGWWLTTGRYDGDIHSLTNHHVEHVYKRRPDVAPFLGLPYGFRFETWDDSAW